MSWDNSWEKVFQTQEWGKYPSEDLIRFIARNFYSVPDRNKIKIIDLGCGTGAGSWFMTREGFSVFGIDGSPTAIEKAKQRFLKEDLSADFRTGDAAQLPYPDKYFDAVIDCACIQHCKSDDIKKIIAEIKRVLKPEGKLFSMLANKETTGFSLGTQLEQNTFTNISEGPLKDKGTTHFFSKQEILDILTDFKIISIEKSDRTYNNQEGVYSQFIVEAILNVNN